jgi:hypothetical protein
MAKHSLTILLLLVALNVAVVIIACRPTNRFQSAPPPASRFNLIIAMLTAFFVGIVIGSQWPAELKSFTQTWGLHTMLIIGTISLLPSILRSAQTQRSTQLD